MSLSAVSVVILVGASVQGNLRDREKAVWRQMSPSVATLVQGGKAVGAAALVDASGLFVAHRASVNGNTVQARLANGSEIAMRVVARDLSTQLVLLEAPSASNLGKPFRAPNAGNPGGTLLAILGTGPIRAEFVQSGLPGVLEQNRRFVPLTEFRFEAPEEAVGTAIVVSESGEFLGALNATLRSKDSATQSLARGLAGGPGNPLTGLPKVAGVNRVGPMPMTVAYTVGSEVVRRVLDGFLSPSREVVYPTLGVMCTDSIGGGALIQVVQPNTAASRADLRAGDVLQDIGGNLIQNQLDFARVMLSREVGKKVTIRLRRGDMILIKDVIVGGVVD